MCDLLLKKGRKMKNDILIILMLFGVVYAGYVMLLVLIMGI